MAVPKRKMSRSRTRHRKANWYRLRKPATTVCPRCKSPRRGHTACAVCGTYRGRDVIETD